ncbi:hypothetical protein [Pararhodobacter sp. CCB-MM2]|uniref:hypothetical protein n=1 Tax=Pararhodobacter sp. CCB-MM2 TaxID=1786003 RepID=UPI0008374DFC|nr:hypothetical protein [Pararhodobacter sp. CCB-MM2]MCA2011299.1 hypothetical protein [Cereibacter sphaeroides]
MKTRIVILAALAGATLLSACGDVPDMRRGFPIRSGGGSSGSTTVMPAPMPTPGAPSSSAAENACMSAGRDAGFGVSGVVGTQEVSGADGIATSRDVMLSVTRGGQALQVRCSYNYASASARIMTL